MSDYVNSELEQTVLGCAMGSARARIDMLDVRPHHFADLRHAALWTLITRMDSDGEAVDPVTVLGALKRIPEMDRRGIDGLYLHQCMALAMNYGAASTYAHQLVNLASLRRLDDAMTRSRQILDGAADAAVALEEIRTEIDSTTPEGSVVHLLSEDIDDTIDSLDQPALIYETPWADINDLIRGWRPGAVYVIASRPGVGKTIMGVQAAYALAHVGPVALNSLEMTRREVHTRLLAQTTGIELRHLDGTGGRFSKLTNSEHERIDRVHDELASLPLSIDDRSSVSVLDVRAHARALSRRGPLAAIVVDYLQLMSSPRREDMRSRQEIVSEQSRQLKILAKEMNCPVIALSQLNRASESRDSKAPSLADLRESGSIEQDADVVFLLHIPEDSTSGQHTPVLDRLVVTIAKNRQGPPGRKVLARDGATAQVYDLQTNQYEQIGA